jgi:hypothetical protein
VRCDVPASLCMQFLNLTVVTTLQWAPSREVAVFYTAAGAGSILANIALFKPISEALGLVRFGIGCNLLRAATWAAMPAAVMLARDTLGGLQGTLLVFSVGLTNTVAHALIGSFQSVALLVRALPHIAQCALLTAFGMRCAPGCCTTMHPACKHTACRTSSAACMHSACRKSLTAAPATLSVERFSAGCKRR